jgi:RHS repeat-associated protein
VYNLNSNPIQITDRKGQISSAQYDGLNRPTFAGFGTQPGPSYQSSTAFTFDAGDRLTAVSDSIAGSITRTYDGLNRVLSEATSLGSVAYTYDADERRQTMTASGQSASQYAYDNASRLLGITQGSQGISFTYDGNWRRTSKTLPNGIAASYGYDAASELTNIFYNGGTFLSGDLSYSYDQAGRRAGISGTLAAAQLPAAVNSGTYNADNQLTAWGSTAMTYDANGNTLNDGTSSYVWDARNQLISTNSNGASFVYDGFGRRFGKTMLSTNTNFLYDGLTPVQELSGASPSANLFTGEIDERFARTDANGTSYYLTDILGSTVALTDTTGSLQVGYTYDPYGNMTISGSTANSYGYTGREYDGLGIDYYRARYYNPQFGRFLSEDPSGLAAGSNLYQYANGSPTNFRDPNGRFVEGCLIGVGGYEWGQMIRGFTGRKMDEGWNWVGNAAKNCAIGFVTEGIGVWMQDVMEMAAAEEAAQAAAAMAGVLGDAGALSGALGDGTIFAHFTDFSGMQGITGLDGLAPGQVATAENLTFNYGTNPFNAYYEGGQFVTDMGYDASSGSLDSIGVYGDRQQFVILMSQETLFLQGFRAVMMDDGIWSIPGGFTINGVFYVFARW